MPPIAEIVDWKKQNQVFDDIAAIGVIGTVTITGAGEPGPIPVQIATANFFTVISRI